MKASVRLITSERLTFNGYPITVTLVDGKKRVKKCIAHCDANFWDFELQIPIKSYKFYNKIMPLVLDYKAKCVTVNLGNYSFDAAKKYLFNAVKIAPIGFFKACEPYCDNTATGKLYATVINSFNDFVPNIAITDITEAVAKKYMLYILKHQKPNGAHTYMRTLNALFNKVSDSKNPFYGVRPKKVKTPQKDMTVTDLKLLFNTRTILHKYDGRNTNFTVNHYRYYFMLMFYLGGIDMVDLAMLRYDLNVVDGRIQFYRQKGGTNAFINNKIFAPAMDILKLFDCYPYLVPIYKYKNYKAFVNNCNKRLSNITEDLNLSRKPLTKSARYTFINRAQELLIDARITSEIVGHVQQSTHSIYTNNFALHVRDAAHEKIITNL